MILFVLSVLLHQSVCIEWVVFSAVPRTNKINKTGVHQEEPLNISGRSLYNKNVSLTFGRCPVRAMFPFALDLLLKRQDIFSCVGEETGLVDLVLSMDDATVKDSYRNFEKGKCGKVLFKPWE